MKGDGGEIGLTEDLEQLTRWMISGPEIARLVDEFEISLPTRSRSSVDTRHHEETKSFQSRFGKHVNSFIECMEEFGNPFCEPSEELMTLDTKDIMDIKVYDTIKNIQSIGESKFSEYMNERLINHSKSLDETIRKNKLPTFAYEPSLNLKGRSVKCEIVFTTIYCKST